MSHLLIANITKTPQAITAGIVFILAYSLVIAEEFIQLKKSKPMMIAAGLMWILVAWIAQKTQGQAIVETALHHYLLEFGSLFLFIVVAMTYINALEEHHLFQVLRGFLIRKKYSYRQLFWITGFLAFFISAVADNLTTALALSAVVIALGKKQPRFVILGCINLVVAANAGGVFSPFGDITTLMVWQADILPINSFLQLFVPALVNYILPAFCLQFALPKGFPSAENKDSRLTPHTLEILTLFICTIVTTVLLHHFFHLPPVIGMMLGLGYLQFYAFYTQNNRKDSRFDMFPMIERIEWDTLLFFYGVILCVGALGTLGYLAMLSNLLYDGHHVPIAHQATFANIVMGLLSSIVDNIPVMFSVLTMEPTLSEGQWLLITLTTGVGGSLLSVGSAAGVALMGQANGTYTFFSHLRWSWAIMLGYAASIAVHLWWNAKLF